MQDKAMKEVALAFLKEPLKHVLDNCEETQDSLNTNLDAYIQSGQAAFEKECIRSVIPEDAQDRNVFWPAALGQKELLQNTMALFEPKTNEIAIALSHYAEKSEDEVLNMQIIASLGWLQRSFLFSPTPCCA